MTCGTSTPDSLGGHLTLDNVTATDIFCGSQLVLPQGGQVFLAGGDNWTGTGTTNTGNNNSNMLHLSSNVLSRGNNINRARWYSSSTVLLNGEVMIQGGSGGTDRPEIRGTDGVFRVLDGANTSSLDFMYPRNFIAPDGRVFGYDSAGAHVLRQRRGQRRVHERRSVRGQLSRQRRQRSDVPARPHPAVRRLIERRGRHRYHEPARPSSRRRNRCHRSDAW